MALVLGTNCGFVTVAPTTNPNGNQEQTLDTQCMAIRHTAPAGATAIVEIGVYVPGATEEANIDLGFYSDAGAGEPEARQQVTTIAKGTGAGWKVATGLNWPITEGTAYWLAAQCDNTATTTTIDEQTTGGDRTATKQGSFTELPADWGTSTFTNASRSFSIYAVYTEGAAATRPAGINRGLINNGLINGGLIR